MVVIDESKLMEKFFISEKIKNLQVERGETQKGVNEKVLQLVTDKFPKKDFFKALDLPCGSGLFLNYVKQLFPNAELTGADIREPGMVNLKNYVQMDLSKNFSLSPAERYDLITSVSGVMMFENTKSFISNCISQLKPNGTFIITNDNSATIIDKFFFLFLGRYRLFKPVFEDKETLTQNISLPELCRLLSIHGLEIETIMFTSTYIKDFIFFPLAVLIYPVQMLYMSRYKTTVSPRLINLMFPFKHYFCRHYIMVARRKD